MSVKDLIRSVLVILGKFFSFKLIIIIIKCYHFIRDNIYSGWVKGQLNVSGKKFFTKTPFQVYNGKNIFIGENFSSSRRNRFETFETFNDEFFTPRIEIGDNFIINDDCHIACINKIKIGNNVLFASKIFITDHLHGDTSEESIILIPLNRKLISKGMVEIGDNVWIGEGVCIMPNVSIGNNCIIGANSVVTKSFPDYSVIAGNPAKIIRNV